LDPAIIDASEETDREAEMAKAMPKKQ